MTAIIAYLTNTHLMADAPHERNEYKVQFHGPPLGVAGVMIGNMYVYQGYTHQSTYYDEKLYQDHWQEKGPCPPNTILTVTEIGQVGTRRLRYHLRGNSWQGWVPANKLYRLIHNDQLQPIPSASQNSIRRRPGTSAAHRYR